jgi:hypothetical protein
MDIRHAYEIFFQEIDGAGNPDFGLYTGSQVQGGEPRKGQIPEL